MGTTNDLAETMAKQLKKDKFGYVGPTTMYAFCQAVGIVQDHAKTCFMYEKFGGRPDLTKKKPENETKKKPAKKKRKTEKSKKAI